MPTMKTQGTTCMASPIECLTHSEEVLGTLASELGPPQPQLRWTPRGATHNASAHQPHRVALGWKAGTFPNIKGEINTTNQQVQHNAILGLSLP